ncbi:pyridoxal-phosphate dependent enzyme [Bacteroidales bacterium OttesenSCG-928-B11]|nr:pyridoxal-phosphate dependent enzyme [Bacteroidales bacterium OttesenSCG-928-E04]MDL2311252.1 pyridoxal-phosphate dependent enzyme [Bacteroidales bacterium OttesenSCG-928-B11]
MVKYRLICKHCGTDNQQFYQWFANNQQCFRCGSKHAEAFYNADYKKLRELYGENPENFWLYFDYLPVENRENIVTCNEGAIPIEEWDFLEKIALEKYGVNCKALVYRNDMNGGTNTFKDVAAALAATVFKENDVPEYCVASTGNTATAYSKYLALAGVKITVFVPNDVTEDSVNEIRGYGQNVVVVDGNYAYAKKMAAEFHEQNKVLMSAGNIDPIRVEAKKTMVFEFMRQLGKMPDVYLQAVSGGTGPIAIDKGVREIRGTYPEVELPRILLVQQDLCDPMVQGWENAESNGFPEGYEKEYPIIENPKTEVSILSTGNPGMFPVVAPIVKKSGGAFLRVKEAELVDLAKKVYQERNIHLGPASVVCLLGFFEALKQGKINDGETVLINTGEGADRARKFKKTYTE